MSDHIHLVVTVISSISLANFIGLVKGSSSHLATHLETPYSDQSFAWQAEYGVTTISESHVPFVVQYVINQQRHHADSTVVDGLEQWD